VRLGTVSLLFFLLAWRCNAQEAVTVARSDGAQTALRVYRPAAGSSASACAPLAVFSPGLGGTEKGYSYLGEGLRDSGWLTIVVGHKESGPRPLMGSIRKLGMHDGMLQMVTDPALYRERLMDVGAALAWAERQCHRPFRALLGHSMGSETVMFEAGAVNKIGVRGEDRFDAYVAISTSGPGSIFPEHAWNKIRKPLYVLTGTEDKGLEGGWQWRTAPFDDLVAGCHWLGVIDGATHMNFAGIGIAGKTKRLTLDSIRAFLKDTREEHCVPPAAEAGLKLQSK
jgi:predicted dienelactone hydrolase